MYFTPSSRIGFFFSLSLHHTFCPPYSRSVGRLLSAPCVLPDALFFIVWMAVSACAFVYNMCGLMAFCACLRIMAKRGSVFFFSPCHCAGDSHGRRRCVFRRSVHPSILFSWMQYLRNALRGFSSHLAHTSPRTRG